MRSKLMGVPYPRGYKLHPRCIARPLYNCCDHMSSFVLDHMHEKFTPQHSTDGRQLSHTASLISCAMSSSSYHLRLLAILALLFLKRIGANDSTAVYVPCKGGSNRLLQLEELVHISDIVVYGVVLSNTITEDEFGTFKASVSYYYAYKNDPLLYRRGLFSVDVLDFPERPSGESSLFFLIRQPNTELSLYCMSTLSELDSSHQTVYDNLFEIVEKVKEVATGELH